MAIVIPIATEQLVKKSLRLGVHPNVVLSLKFKYQYTNNALILCIRSDMIFTNTTQLATRTHKYMTKHWPPVTR